MADLSRVESCPCGNMKLEAPAYETWDRERRFALRRCPCCRRWLLDPRPTEEALFRYYDSDYLGTGERGKFSRLLEAFVDRFRQRRARRAHRLLKRPGRVLDIGCGNGGFLFHLLRRGHECHGTELSAETARRAGRIHGLQLHVGPLSAATYPPGSFDLVSLWHVLEHLPEPERILGYCHRWLTPGGHLLVAVPNIGSWQARLFRGAWFHLDPPRHLFHFTPASLGFLLECSGFRLERLGHLSWEQNLYGFLQSFLNALGFPRDELYERLKGNRPLLTGPSGLLQLALAGLFLPPAVPLTLLEAAWQRGGSLEGVARNSGGEARC